MFALDQVREAGGEFNNLKTTRDLAKRVGDDLAVLGGDDLCQLSLAFVEQLAEPEQNLLALCDRQIPPGGEGLAG